MRDLIYLSLISIILLSVLSIPAVLNLFFFSLIGLTNRVLSPKLIYQFIHPHFVLFQTIKKTVIKLPCPANQITVQACSLCFKFITQNKFDHIKLHIFPKTKNTVAEHGASSDLHFDGGVSTIYFANISHRKSVSIVFISFLPPPPSLFLCLSWNFSVFVNW